MTDFKKEVEELFDALANVSMDVEDQSIKYISKETYIDHMLLMYEKGYNHGEYIGWNHAATSTNHILDQILPNAAAA